MYDTTVPLYPEAPWIGERVYNTGRMHNRLVGILVGFGSLAAGIALTKLFWKSSAAK